MNQYLRHLGTLLAAICLTAFDAGCQTTQVQREYRNPYPQPRSLAVVPFINQSGSENLDVLAVTDEFYTELQLVEGFTVVPVNRVLAAMNQLGLNGISSPEDAFSIADNLGVDGVIIGSITQYDPYPPPRVGMAVQLYVREQRKNTALTPMIHSNRVPWCDRPNLSICPLAPNYDRHGLARILDADQKDVVERLKKYAQTRTGQQRPARWQSYTTQRNYLRFVAHEIIGELIAQEKNWLMTQKLGG